MNRAANSQTRITLLLRLRQDPADPHAWAEFVDHYGGKVLGWCRAWGLQDADARDVAQEVLLRLADRMSHFDYDPSKSFRAWLKTVTRHAWGAFVDARRRPGAGSGDTGIQEQLLSVPARDDLLQRLEAAFDGELLEEAGRRVRLRVEPRTWEAFRLTAVEGLSGAEASQRLGMRASQVYVAKKRVREMLREEVENLDRGG
jgi:RNA polymerase sigma-70 factor (ECF subfamily)